MSDRDLMRQLSDELGRYIPEKELPKDNESFYGYVLNEDGQLIALGLPSCQIADNSPLFTQLRSMPQLQTLYLSNNQISDVSFLQHVPQLQTLYLSNNQISDVSFLQHVPQLQTLNLRNNQISDVSFLQHVQQLQTLYLRNNPISDVSFLQHVPQLQTLDISYNRISDYSFLQHVPRLQTLNLSNNRISDYSFLQHVPQLQTLDISYNRISDYSFLQHVQQLQTLNLISNQISDVSFLQHMPRLQTLYLRNNQISDVSFLQHVPQLQTLDISFNPISDYSFLQHVQQLQTLNLSNNRISNYSFLQQVPQLQTLDISFNGISDVSFLQHVPQLQTLDISFNQISDYSFLQHMSQLQTLYLRDNQISDLSFLQNVPQLQTLDLSNNRITDLSPLQYLPKLEKTALDDNQISRLPALISNLKPHLVLTHGMQNGRITLYNNPIEHPPVEIVKQGRAAMRAYFDSLAAQKTVLLNEVKVLLVGEGMAGKTSLLKRFQGLDFDKDESQTHGVNVVAIKGEQMFKEPQLSKATLHCWDFGGQEIMHASHQFFLSERAVYILLLDSRTDSKKYHWLKHIEKFGGDSPVIVVMNKIDDNPNYNIRQKDINDTFPNVQNRFHRISCRTKAGLPTLLETLAQTIPTTSLYGTPISQAWLNIKNELVAETQAQQYIGRTRFQEICQNNKVEDEISQQTLLQFLHDLGVVLYFKQLNLANIYVLDPHWVTIGVYKIVNSAKVAGGILHESDLNFILNHEEIKQEEYDPAKEKAIQYSPQEQHYILEIMMQFELGYRYNEQKRQYMIPALLPPQLADEPQLTEADALRFVLAYDYLPTSILFRLMLRFRNDIVADEQWRYGMVLQDKNTNCTALIKSVEQHKQITITIVGEFSQKRQYFSTVHHAITTLNSEFENLEVTKLIPLPGYPDRLVEYEELLGYERAGKEAYFSGKLGQSFSVSSMLDSVMSREEREREGRAYDHKVTYPGRNPIAQADQETRMFVSTQALKQKEDALRQQVARLNKQRDETGEELSKLKRLKSRCEEIGKQRVERKRIRFYLLEAFFLVVLVTAISLLGWDVMEQWTFVVAGIVWVLQFIIAYLNYGYASLGDAFAAIEQKEIEGVYAELEYLPQKHARLQRERDQIEADIRSFVSGD